MKNFRLTISVVLLIILIGVLGVAKVNQPEEVPEAVKEATTEEIVKEKEKQEEQVPEEPPVELTPQEQARMNLVEKHGEEVVEAWERLSRDEFFDYIGYRMVVEQHRGPEGEIYYHCYKIAEDGTVKDACVGGNYYVYGVFVSNEAMFDLVDYHNNFFATPQN